MVPFYYSNSCLFSILKLFIFVVFFTLFAVNIDSIVSFDHSSKAVGWQPKAHTNLNFQPENVFTVLILTLWTLGFQYTFFGYWNLPVAIFFHPRIPHSRPVLSGFSIKENYCRRRYRAVNSLFSRYNRCVKPFLLRAISIYLEARFRDLSFWLPS